MKPGLVDRREYEYVRHGTQCLIANFAVTTGALIAPTVGPTHRIRFVYTPKHTSWLSQVEIWFSILMRRLLKRASVISAASLPSKE